MTEGNRPSRIDLAAFRASHPERRHGAWTYLAAGAGARALVVLPGGLRLAEPAQAIITAFEGDRRVIVPNYPPLATLAALADGLAALLDAEGLSNVDVMGSSLGGMLAQVFIQRHPQRVASLILVSTFAPEPRAVARFKRQKALIHLVPGFYLRKVMTRVYQSFTTPSPEDKAFWDAYMAEAVRSRLTRADFLATQANVLDFHERFRPAPVSHRMLILDSDDDPVVAPAQQDALIALYPGARHVRLHGAGHTTFMSKPVEAIAALKTFLG
ncbi:MAG: alpha/beta hydrolase fold protein [Cyanobacteria bacterium RYN_339]|nr:alpha/beta hydrolase fold protein [Cyanobacteria bacterium RYN_339]